MDSYISEFVKPYNFISLNLNSRYILYGLMNIIIELDDIFFYIEDKSEVINDISKMPIYIRLDWLKYNRNELDLKTVNKHIEYHKNNEDDISELIMIRRDIIIKMTFK
jgi:hypothetical protein